VLGSRVPVGARRALAALGAWALGIALVRWLFGAGVVIPAGVWSGGAGVCIAGALVARDRWLGVMLLVACVLLGSGWASFRWFEPPGDSLVVRLSSQTASGDRFPIEIRAVVTEGPVLSRPAAGALAEAARWLPESWSFTVETKAVHAAGSGGSEGGWEAASGSLRVFAGEEEPVGFEPGQTVELMGLFSPVRPPLNPGGFEVQLRAGESGRSGTLSIGELRVVAPVQPAGWFASVRTRTMSWVRSVRARARVAVLGESSEPSAPRAVVAALVLGEREQGASDVRAAFARQGVAHLLAISGFHLVLVCAVVLFVSRSLIGGRVGTRWGSVIEPLAVALVVVGYLVLVPAKPPIVRSGLMVLGLLAAEISGRRYHGLGVIAWVGVAMLAWKPSWLFETGFQFSFLMTGSLIWLGGRVDAAFARRKLDASPVPPDVFDRGWWWGLIRRPFSAGVVCWAVGAPIVAARFGWLSPLAVLSTVVLLPTVAMVLVAGVCVSFLAAMGLGVQASGVLEAVASPAAAYVMVIDSWRWTYVRVPPTPAWLGWCGCILVLGWFGGAQRHRRLLQLASGVWVVALVVIWSGPRFYGPEASIDTFAVGDGTCIVIRSRGEALLWDAGSTRPDLGVWELPRAMRAAGIGRVRTAIITHANFDHFSALPDLAEPLGIERVLVSEAFMTRRDQPAVAMLFDELDARGIAVEILTEGDTLELGRCSIEVLSAIGAGRLVSVNDESIVAMLRTPSGTSALLTGDIQEAAMEALAAVDVRADVLELPHHGSAHEHSVRFLARVEPKVVLQSTGPSRVNDPRWGNRSQVNAWRTTATDGWTRVELWSDHLTVRSMHAPTRKIAISAGR